MPRKSRPLADSTLDPRKKLKDLHVLIGQLHRQAILQRELGRKVCSKWLIDWVEKTREAS